MKEMFADIGDAQNQDRGVIYLGRIPHGFFEDQMRAYFSQFGDVTRLRLSRNKKVRISSSLRSNHAFIPLFLDVYHSASSYR